MTEKHKSPDHAGTPLPKRRHIEAWLDRAERPIASVEPSQLDVPPSTPSNIASTIPTPETTKHESPRSSVRSDAPSGDLNANIDHGAFKEALRVYDILDADLEIGKCKPKPNNWDELQNVLNLERSSPELEAGDMERIHKLISHASNESQMNRWLCPYMVKDVDWVGGPFDMRILQNGLWTRAVSPAYLVRCKKLVRRADRFDIGVSTSS